MLNKYEVKAIKNNKSNLNNKIKKMNAIYNVPKSLFQYNKNRKTQTTSEAYQNLKKLHPILKKNAKYYFKLAELAIDLQKWEEAIHYLNKAIENDIENTMNLYYVRATVFEKLNKKKESIKSIKKYLKLNKNDKNALIKLADLEMGNKNFTSAKHHINQYLSYEPFDKKAKLMLKHCLEHSGEYYSIIEMLEDDLEKDSDNGLILLELSKLFNKVNDNKAEVEYLEKYVAIYPNDVDNIIKLIHYLEDLNEYDKAIHYYSLILSNEETMLTKNMLSAYYYRKGQLEYRLNRFKGAKQSYDKAVQYSEDPLVKKWGIGYLHEKSKNYGQAINTYQIRLEDENDNSELYYKIGILLKKQGELETAISNFEKALEFNKVRSPWHYQLALCYEEIQDYESAAIAYHNAILRQQTHRPDNFRKLAYVLEKIGRNEDALAAYREAELFRKPSYMSNIAYNKHLKSISVRYAESYEYYDIESNMVFYESMSGAGIVGNPAAIFDSLYNNKLFNTFTHVWVINSFDNIPEHMKDKSNIIFVKKNSDAYLKYISKAKYLICNSTFSDFVVRKEEQKYLQTTHGIFYKTVGRDSNRSKLGVAGSTRNLLQATHVIAPNQFMIDKLKSAYSIGDIHVGEVAKVGYPRIDTTLNATETQKNNIKNRMNINNEKDIVLYAPTWRGETKGSNEFDINKLIHDLKELSKIEANILFRGHSITQALLKDIVFPENIIIPPGDISTNHLMSVVDILISDYSSVFFDFIPTGKPIIHYIYDIEEYTTVRGLNLSIDELPGHIAKNTEELVSSVDYCLKNQDPSDNYLEAKKRFCPYDFGESSNHVIQWFFKDDTTKVDIIPFEKSNDKILFLLGKLSNNENVNNLITDITSATREKNTVSLSLKKGIIDEPTKANPILAFGNDINLLPHAGPMVKTLEEIIAIQDIEKRNKIRNNKTQMLYERAYQRENRRLFGDIQFDYIYNFEEGFNYWSSLYEIMKKNSI